MVTPGAAGTWPASLVMICSLSVPTSWRASATARSMFLLLGLMYQPSVPVRGLALPVAGGIGATARFSPRALEKSAVCHGPSMTAVSLPVWKSCLRALPSV